MAKPLSHTDAVNIETVELEAWRDMYRAVPLGFRQQLDPNLIEIDQVLMTVCPSIPFVHFNAVLNLGLRSPATEATVDAVIAAYQAASIRRITVMHHPFCQPSSLPDWLTARGFQARPGWDRVYRFGTPSGQDPSPERDDVAFVTAETASSWARFIDGLYGLPTSPWLMELVGRSGWVHAMLVRCGRTVAARSMFLGPDHGAWFGIEAPIPGLMAPSYEDDHCLLHALISEAVREGTQTFVGDVEAASPAQAGPAYDRWGALGFAVGYHRSHYVRG